MISLPFCAAANILIENQSTVLGVSIFGIRTTYMETLGSCRAKHWSFPVVLMKEK